MSRIVVKEGPLVFLRNVLVMECVAAVFLYIISLLNNYGKLYQNLRLDHYIRYDIFLIVVFSGFQLLYVSLLFLDWYFSYFEISDKEISWRSGLIFRHRKSVSLHDIVSVEIYQSPFGRVMRHATLIIDHGRGRVTKMKNIPNADECARMVKKMVHGQYGRLLARDVKSILEEGEGFGVEFKETLRYDTRRGEVSREMERMVMKTVVAFMNGNGGTLLIGVNDSGEVMGLENDYKALPKKNRDGLENHLNMLMKTTIGLPFTKYISVKFEKVDGKEVCAISVGESHKPVYLRDNDRKEEFFVRVGNSTQPFSMSEAEEYIKTRW